MRAFMIVKLRGGIRQLNCQFLSFRAWNNVSLFPDFFFQTKTSDDSIDDDNWTQEDKPRSNGGEGDAVCRNEDALKQIQIACAYAPHIIPSFVHSLSLSVQTDRLPTSCSFTRRVLSHVLQISTQVAWVFTITFKGSTLLKQFSSQAS